MCVSIQKDAVNGKQNREPKRKKCVKTGPFMENTIVRDPGQPAKFKLLLFRPVCQFCTYLFLFLFWKQKMSQRYSAELDDVCLFIYLFLSFFEMRGLEVTAFETEMIRS